MTTQRTPATLTRLLRHANENGQLLDAIPLLTTGSRFIPTFPVELTGRHVLVSDGHTEPQLICVPSFLAGSGAHQFVRLATAFVPRVRVSALVPPGFDRGAAVPASWAAALDALAAAVRDIADGEPYVLVGHSIGGVVACSLATRLAATEPAAGVVLVDTLAPDPARQDTMLEWALANVLDRDPGGLVINDDSLLAMGAYLRIFQECEQDRPAAPVLQVSATAGPWPAWDIADTTAAVAADHFSVLEEHAAMTAKVIETWLPR
jgi:pimeloyl-ACP methyl ester carboxylesterase